VVVELSVVVFVDVHQPSRIPSATVGAPDAVAALANVDAVTVLDRLAACPLQGFGEEVRLVGKLLRRHPARIGGGPEREQRSEDREREKQLGERETFEFWPCDCLLAIHPTLLLRLHLRVSDSAAMLLPRRRNRTSTDDLSHWAD